MSNNDFLDTDDFNRRLSLSDTISSKQSLMEAASAISHGKNDVAAEILARLAPAANPRGDSEQRLTEMMVSALKSRLNGVENRPLVAHEHVSLTQMLSDISPCFKLGFMAANQAIIEAAIGGQSTVDKIHVVDFDVGRGGQYVNLLRALSSLRDCKPSAVKITTVAESVADEGLSEVGEMLGRLADGIGVRLHFNVVTRKLTELTRESLGCEADEVLAVNFAFGLYRMDGNQRDELLRLVKGLGPLVVTVVEQEMNTETGSFVERVAETSAYYGTLLESIEAVVARESPERVKVEEGLGRRVVNSVACEGRDRVERSEVFGKWRERMVMAGFELRPLSHQMAESMRARLSSGKRKTAVVSFGGKSQTLLVTSAWC